MSEKLTPAQVRSLMIAKQRTRLEDDLVHKLALAGLPKPSREYRFHPIRRWRFDLAWPVHKLAVEVDGGTYSGGRHVRGAGFERDCEKFNAATIAGWRVMHFTGGMIRSGEAVRAITEALKK
jgi:very-short-patch-repair endonuclease